MIFLIDYDRKGGRMRLFKSFKAEQRAEAQRERLEIELSLNGSRGSREVVLLRHTTSRLCTARISGILRLPKKSSSLCPRWCPLFLNSLTLRVG